MNFFRGIEKAGSGGMGKAYGGGLLQVYREYASTLRANHAS